MYELKTFDQVGAEKWDEFILACANGSIHQTSNWKHLQEKVPTRGKVLGFAAVNNHRLEAVCLTVRMKTGAMNTEWYYSGRGPVFSSNKAAEFLIKEVANILREQTSALFWRLDPYVLKSESSFNFKGLKTKPASANYHPLNSSIISLDLPVRTILSGLKKKRRYDVRKGLDNFKITHISGGKVSSEQIDKFYNLLTVTSKRDGFSPHPKKYYDDFLQTLGDKSLLWFAEKNGQLAASAISTISGDTATYYFAATTTDSQLRKLGPAHGLLWSIIKHASENNCLQLDLLGIAPDNQPNHPYAGITKFKNSFGGKPVTYQKGTEVILRPFGYYLYRIAKMVKR